MEWKGDGRQQRKNLRTAIYGNVEIEGKAGGKQLRTPHNGSMPRASLQGSTSSKNTTNSYKFNGINSGFSENQKGKWLSRQTRLYTV